MGNSLINTVTAEVSPYSASATLTPGLHAFRFLFDQGGGNIAAQLSYRDRTPAIR